MKTAKEMLNERLSVQNGHFKGARITITEQMCIELMNDFASQKDGTLREEASCKIIIPRSQYVEVMALLRSQDYSPDVVIGTPQQIDASQKPLPSDIDSLIELFIKKELPHAKETFHHEAEIAVGLREFKEWIINYK